MATILFSLMKVCCSCTAWFGLAAGVGDDELHLLAEHAFGDFGRDLLDQIVAAVDVLDGELHALEFVLALHRVGAGARHRGADGDGRPASRPARCPSPACRRRSRHESETADRKGA